VTLATITSVLAVLLGSFTCANADDAARQYSKMAALSEYLSPSKADEITLAKSAAPPSLSNGAEIQVFGVHGYRTAVEGHNGFVCMVWRSWSDDFEDKEFWNSKIRAPICLNPAAVRTVLPEYIKHTNWVLAGISRADMLARFKAAVDRKEVTLPAPGAMSYMMSARGFLGDSVGHAMPHIMFFVPRAERQQWGANLAGSPISNAEGPPDPIGLFFVAVAHWSDGSSATADMRE
jgi:hypothetical protein